MYSRITFIVPKFLLTTTPTMTPILLLLLLCSAPAALSHATTAYPSIPGTTPVDISADPLIPPRREVYGNGRIFDISHRYTPDMPAFESVDGVGQFLWLPYSMKNGSLANNSEMKLPSHTGTHVDAPGHVFDHYFDAGFDVDTLDLDVLNGNPVGLCFNFSTWVLKSLQLFVDSNHENLFFFIHRCGIVS